jgi:hypothetical protein
MCPHCGKLVKTAPLVPTHDWPATIRQVCPGSGQIPRCAESDARPLWNGEPNPHFGVRT